MLRHSYFIPKRNRRKQTCFTLKIFAEKQMKLQNVLYTELKTSVSNCMILVLCYTKRQDEEESNKKELSETFFLQTSSSKQLFLSSSCFRV
jgi:hypothetical protein